MSHREGTDRKIIDLEEFTRLQLMQLDWDGWFGAPQHDIEKQVMNAIQCRTTAVNIQRIDRFPAHIGREQAGQAQDVIQVAVRDQDLVQALETDAGLKDLALCTLPAVNQKAVLIMLDNLG